MNDSYVTLQGYAGGDVELREAGGSPVATLRVGSTPRYQRGGDWVDGETQWYSVSCWRTLATNVAASVRKGDAVVVHGRVRVETWTRTDGSPATTWKVDASFVGHDLNRGRARFAKPPREDGRDDTRVQVAADPLAGPPVEAVVEPGAEPVAEPVVVPAA